MNLRINIVILISFFIINQAQTQNSEKYILDSLRVDSMRFIQFSNQIAALKLGFNILENQTTEKANQITARTLTSIANILTNQGFYALAEEYYSESLKNYTKLKDSIAIGWVYINMGNLNFKNKLYNYATNNYKKGLNIFNKIVHISGQATSYNNLALVDVENKDLDSALIHFQKALNIRKKINYSPLIAHSYIYIGDVYNRKGQIEEAQNYFHKALQIGLLTNAYYITGRSSQFLGIINYKIGHDSLATYYFKLAEDDFITKRNSNYLFKLFKEKALLYKNSQKETEAINQLFKALEIAKQQGNITSQIDIYEELLSFQDQGLIKHNINETSWNKELYKLYKVLYQTEAGKSLALMDLRGELNGYQSKIKLKELEISRARILKNLSFAVGFLALLLLFISFRKYREEQKRTAEIILQKEKNFKQELAIEHLKTEQIKQKLEVDQRELVMKATFLEQYNSLIGGFSSELKYQISLLNSDHSKGLKRLLSTMTNSSKPDNILKDFENQFILVYPGFLEALAHKFPHLSAKDLKMCAFHKMNLDTKEIAQITGLTVRAVQTSRYRLRQKLNIPKDIQLLAFLNEQ